MPINVVTDPIARTFSIHGLTYQQAVDLREMMKAAAAVHQEAMAESGGQPQNDQEAETVALVHGLYLALKAQTR